MSSITGQSISFEPPIESAYTFHSISLASHHQPDRQLTEPIGGSNLNMILLGLGGNLPSRRFGAPQATLEAALLALEERAVRVRRRSRWYRTRPVPDDGQPWYVNGVAELETVLPPHELLARALEVESAFGRVRRRRWAPRVIDLDILAYHDHENWGAVPAVAPIVPHPRLHERAFVLVPLVELAPGWRHPVFGRTAAELLAALPTGQFVAELEPPAAAPAGGVAGGGRTR
jgi:2-amino-4-hydroxy-6-hydroxymethyldihydropteridine diphosphokinase